MFAPQPQGWSQRPPPSYGPRATTDYSNTLYSGESHSRDKRPATPRAQVKPLSVSSLPGFLNPGGSQNCFVNVVLQIFLHSSDLWSVVSESAQDHVDQCAAGPRRCALCCFVYVMAVRLSWPREMSSSEARFYLANPPSGPKFELREQHDAPEAFAALLDGLHNVSHGKANASLPKDVCYPPCLAHRVFGWTIGESSECPSCHFQMGRTAYSTTFLTAAAASVADILRRTPAPLSIAFGDASCPELRACDRCNSKVPVRRVELGSAPFFSLALGWSHDSASTVTVTPQLKVIIQALSATLCTRALFDSMNSRQHPQSCKDCETVADLVAVVVYRCQSRGVGGFGHYMVAVRSDTISNLRCSRADTSDMHRAAATLARYGDRWTTAQQGGTLDAMRWTIFDDNYVSDVGSLPHFRQHMLDMQLHPVLLHYRQRAHQVQPLTTSVVSRFMAASNDASPGSPRRDRQAADAANVASSPRAPGSRVPVIMPAPRGGEPDNVVVLCADAFPHNDARIAPAVVELTGDSFPHASSRRTDNSSCERGSQQAKDLAIATRLQRQEEQENEETRLSHRIAADLQRQENELAAKRAEQLATDAQIAQQMHQRDIRYKANVSSSPATPRHPPLTKSASPADTSSPATPRRSLGITTSQAFYGAPPQYLRRM